MALLSNILEVKNLTKTVKANGQELKILSECNFTVKQGCSAAIVGRSGSGKSTLLSLLAGLDNPSCGEIWLAQQPLHQLNEEQRAQVRAKEVGCIFQSFMLIQSLTALENVMLPLELANQPRAKQRALDLLAEVDLSHRHNHYPNQLSGGEQQRVAIARAFACQPSILFADEPTGNLDADNAAKIEQCLFNLNAQHNTTLVIVTHDQQLASQCQTTYLMNAGMLSIV